MLVYCVFGHVEYEGDTLLAIYGDSESAYECVSSLEEGEDYQTFSVVSWVVEGLDWQ